MTGQNNLPNGRLLLEGLMLTRERFQTGSKVAIPIPILRELFTIAVSTLPFDQEFYLAAYPDIKEAFASGQVSDLWSHFIEEGYFEGKLGSKPEVDEDFYKETYPDVAIAIADGSFGSAIDHYVRAGAYEGRFANQTNMQTAKRWLDHLVRR